MKRFFSPCDRRTYFMFKNQQRLPTRKEEAMSEGSNLPKGFIPLPTIIGGSPVRERERISGTPSKMYPILRDLAESTEYRSYVEFDLEKGRERGAVHKSSSNDGLWVNPPVRSCNPTSENVEDWTLGSPKLLSFKKIIAFRVLAVERV